MPSNFELVCTWMKRVWRDEDADAIDDLADPNAVFNSLEEGTIWGTAAFRQHHAMILSRLGAFDFEIDRHIEAGEWVAVKGWVSCRYRPTQKRLRVRFFVMARFVGGKMIEGHKELDVFKLFEMAGQVPPRALDRVVLGESMEFVNAPRAIRSS